MSEPVATYHAIGTTSRAILGLLESAVPRDEFEQATFRLYHAKHFDEPMREGVSLFLYRLSINTAVRNLPPRTSPDGRRFRPSLPVDLHYLLTAWADDVEKQQRLLGWCIRTLEDTPILPAGVLNHPIGEGDVFRADETVEVTCDPLALADLVNVWDKLKPRLQTSITYVARMVALESTRELPEREPVQTREFRVGHPAR